MRITNLVIVASAIWSLVSFWHRNDLPEHVDGIPQLVNEPLQTQAGVQPFNAIYEDVEYLVSPEFDYELYGLVVSFRHHNQNSRMHFMANDHLNMLDVCVVWGGTASSEFLGKIDFWNGIFTCVVSTRDQQAWDAFEMTELSNNHLLSDDPFIRNQVKRIRVGDQIRIRGYLASYGSAGGGSRGTSTTRLDTGDGACETIFVNDFEILRQAPGHWRLSMYAALALLLGALLLHFKRPYRPYRDA